MNNTNDAICPSNALPEEYVKAVRRSAKKKADDIAKKLKLHATWLADPSTGKRLTLRVACGANLSGADLRRANLSYCDLSEANLSGADLSGANLKGAGLYGANLSGANLEGANLVNATIFRAVFDGSNLKNTVFSIQE